MPNYCSFLLIFLFSWNILWAQDERYFRKMFSGDMVKKDVPQEAQKIHFKVTGNSYRIDLDDDKIEEIIEPQKRDGVDWIEIRNSSGNKLFEGKVFAAGTGSYLYKIKFVSLSPDVKALILFMDEGVISGKKFESTGRIFILTYEKNNLSKIHLTEGPHFFHEREGQREQYWRRTYTVNVWDIDKDGIREVSVEFNNIQRIMKYIGGGVWKKI